MSSKIDLRLRFKFGSMILLGPGKHDLLEGIERTGSISAAARAMAMSYKRAWLLIDEMNRTFTTPVVAAQFGGAKGGGASLTPFGREVLARYQNIVAATQHAVADDLAWLNDNTVDKVN